MVIAVDSEFVFFCLTVLSTGAMAGLSAGLFGVGGGVIIVPMLLLIFKHMNIGANSAMLLAIGTSLATIIPTSITSWFAHRKHGSADFALLKSWALPLIVGSALGSYFAGFLPNQLLKLAFGFVALVIATYMVLPLREETPRSLPAGHLLSLISVMVGSISALVGIGGGALAVPIMVFFGTPIRRAIGTASGIGLFVSLPATVVFMMGEAPQGLMPPFTLGHVNWLAFIFMAITGMIVAPIGAKLAHKLPRQRLKQAFAGYLVLIGCAMINAGMKFA